MSPEERLRSQRAARLKADQVLLRDLQDAYGRSFDQVRRELARLTKQIAEARAAGQVVSTSWLFEAQRLQRFERELGQHLAIYLDLAKRKIEAASVRALIDGQTDARSLLVSTVPGGLGVAPALPVEQLERMVLGTRPGTPLGTLLAGLGARAQQEAREKLIEGVALGLGTREIGRNLRTSFAGNGIRALLVARTEVIRTYRDAALSTYRKNQNVVQGWYWIASLGPRTCAVCIAKHGSFHSLDEEFASHPSCRCSPAPATKSWADLGFPDLDETRIEPETGEEWFARQDPLIQRRILGPGKHKLYEDGEIKLGDLVQDTSHPVWGRGVREVALRDITGITSDARALMPVPKSNPLTGLMICQSLCKSRVGFARGRELKGKEWVETGPGEGRIERREKDGRVLVNAGTNTKPRWVAVNEADVRPPDKKAIPYRVGSKAKSGLNQDFKGFREGLTVDERQALGTYQGPAFKGINHMLRTGGVGQRYRKTVEGLDSAIEKGRISAPTKMYRGVDSREKLFGTRDLDSIVGKELIDPGFVSTTSAESVAIQFTQNAAGRGTNGAIIEMLLPEGTKGAWMRESLEKKGLTLTEDEFILPRGMRFRVAGIKRSKHGAPTIIVEVIG